MVSPPVLALIPARRGSTRLPDKPLQDLGGAPLVWRVVEAARRCPAIDTVWVATDDAEVAAAVTGRGGVAVRVDTPCPSGTARVAAAVAAHAPDLPPEAVVVNVQGDEPFVAPEVLAGLVAAVQAGAPIATAAAPLPEGALHDRHAVKVVCDDTGHALYFSRAAIPGRLHLGLYAFSPAALAAAAALPRGELAEAEDLEQLAWLAAGWPIRVVSAPPAEPGIDTPDDLARARARFAATPSLPSPSP